MARRKKQVKRTAAPTYPNAGVEAWYRGRLQAFVREMARDMLRMVRAVWNEGGGLATDSLAAHPTHDAAGVMFWHFGEVLLLHRTDGEGWAFPGGGLEPGEDTYRCALRECTEEMGYVHNPAVNGVLEFHHTEHWNGVCFATYQCKLLARFVPQLNDEHDRYMWVRPAVAVKCLKLHPGVHHTLVPFASPSIAADAKPTTPLLLQRALERWGGLWVRRIDKAALNISTDFAKRAKKAIDAAVTRQLVQAGFAIKFKPTQTMATAFDAVIAENVGLIRSIPQKFLSDVQTIVWQGVMNGSNMQQISEGIQQKYNIAHRRAALIASDQNAKAKAAMERARRKEAGITSAIWQHSHAGVDPRPTHVAMDGEEYPIDEGMWDPAVKKYVWPGTEINCRCTDRPVIPGFA